MGFAGEIFFVVTVVKTAYTHSFHPQEHDGIMLAAALVPHQVPGSVTGTPVSRL